MGKLSQLSVPRSSVRGLLLVAAALGSSLSFAAARQAVPESSRSSISGGVRTCDVQARTLVVIHGVGYAMRSVRVGVPPGCQVRAAGAPVDIGALKPGTPVRIQYVEVHDAAARKTALTIDILRPQGGGS